MEVSQALLITPGEVTPLPLDDGLLKGVKPPAPQDRETFSQQLVAAER